MKKLFLLFALVAMCSCGPVNNKTEQSILEEFDRITHFTYKGHKYISFETSVVLNTARMGIVHDPNCPCHESIH